jgi:CRP/FNR family transcriptional regulator, dissimilatory nitrate respiration regulator
MTEDSIAHIPLFEGLPQSHLDKLRSIAGQVRYDKEAMVFLEGEDAEGFYVVLEGKVKIYKISPEGKEQVIQVMGQGEPFAEVPVFAGGRFPAHAQAVTACRLLYFPRTALTDLFRRDSAMAMNMLAVLAKRLRRLTDMIESLTLKESPGRLAAYLLDLSERADDADVVELDMSKGLLANLLGTAQETLSRILKRMSEQEIIKVRGRFITLLDKNTLEQVATGEIRLG